jgi:nucleotide-binding universal stress UspA family protein
LLSFPFSASIHPPSPSHLSSKPLLLKTQKQLSQQQKEALQKAEAFIATRFVPVLEAAKKEYAAEVVHFATDADSVAAIVEARALKLDASAVVLAKHAKGVVKQLFLGSTAKHLVASCPVPVVVLHA